MAKLIKVVRVEVFRSVVPYLEDDANDAELAAVEEVCAACPGAVVQVYDCEGRYLYTPQGEEDAALILGDPQAGVRAVVEEQAKEGR